VIAGRRVAHGLIPSSIVVGIARFTGWNGGEMVFATALPFMPSRGLQGQRCKELISCLSPRVV
jgi:hypothetical protein